MGDMGTRKRTGHTEPGTTTEATTAGDARAEGGRAGERGLTVHGAPDDALPEGFLPRPVLEYIEVRGGYLDGLRFQFHPCFNAIIGGRGSG
jgi:hypothetical protein